MKPQILILILFCLSVGGYAQLPDKDWGEPGNTIYGYLKEAKLNFESGQEDIAFKKFFACQNYSGKFELDEIFFLTTIELANFHIITGSIHKAKDEFLKISPSIRYMPESRCKYHHRLAFYYNQIGVADSARFFSFNALSIANKFDLDESKGTIYNELGNIYEKARVYDSSRYYYDLASTTFEKNSFDYANAVLNKSRTYYHSKDFDSAVIYLENLLKMVDSSDWLGIKAAASHFKAISHLEMGDSLKSARTEVSRLNYEVEILRKYNEQKLSDLNIAFETEEKNAEIKEQQFQIKKEKENSTRLTWLLVSAFVILLILIFLFFVIRRTNNRLKQLVKENEFLVGEANHRIKNNLQIIVSLVSREMIKHDGDSKDVDSLKNIASKIESISSLHQQLYVNEEKDAIDIKSYLEKLQLNLNELLNNSGVDLRLNVESGLLCNVTKSLYVGLLFNELVINSIKHAFLEDQENRIIEVSCSPMGKQLQIVYRDNGAGIEANKTPKLVDMMSRQMKGEYCINNLDGFHYTITFKSL